MGIREFFRNRVNRVAEGMDVFKKDVFELEGVPAFREYYTLFIFVWQAIYKGFYKAWHEVPLKTIRDPKGKTRTLATMNAGKMACAQMARYVWNERCSITASMANAPKDDPLDGFLQYVLKDNRFGSAFGDLLEKSFALGGGALKEWVEIPKDENGNDLGEGKVRIGYTMASQFVPTAWDNSKVTSGIFVSREARDGYYYTVVEWHHWDGTTYRITNDLYRQPIKGSEPQNILGWWYPLDKVYPLLCPDTSIEDVNQAFFQYIRPFGANYADDEVWEALATDNPEDLKIYDNSVDLRVEPHITGINGDLSILCAQIGFDPGTLSFDTTKGLKTATEVISENSKTFGTVKAHENLLKDALVDMVHAIFDLAARYGLTWEGKTIESLVSGGYDVSVKFDDSIIEDKNAEINRGVSLVGAGLLSKKKFMTDMLGYTPEDADSELKQISEEQRTNSVVVDRIFGGME